MTLDPGARLGPYEILDPIGAGGMGEVYRARDTRLERTVAIKVLRADFARDPSSAQRFEREARALSSLEHPNICRLYDVGVEREVRFLVLEFLKGETLAARLAQGALPAPAALEVAIQIADALDRAHRTGLVHRDLKPGNVILTRGGAKLVDFGLAKSARALAGQGGAALPDSGLTSQGTLLGTLAYMAPEQLRGQEADARSDLFAFGALLYEMLGARPAFPGSDPASVIAAVLEREPPPLADAVPGLDPALEGLVRRALAKDPEERWQSARDLAHELRRIAASGPSPRPGAAPARGRERVAWILAGVGILGSASFLISSWPRRAPERARAVHLSFVPPAYAAVRDFDHATLSSDGRQLAFVGHDTAGVSTLWVRDLGSGELRPLAGTEGASQPFWSPDARSLAFFVENRLARVDLAGGPPTDVCRTVGAGGGAWAPDGTILYGGPDGVMRVSERGGAPAAATRAGENEEAHRWPSMLPDGRHFVFLADSGRTEDHLLRLGELGQETTRVLAQAVSNVECLGPEHLVYVRAGTLLAQRFDPATLALAGDPFPLAREIVENDANHHFEFCASAGGTLAYRSVDQRRQLAWVDRSGRRLETLGAPDHFGGATLAPDGRSIVYMLRDADGRAGDLWTLDLARGASTRITFAPESDYGAVWSPDGQRVVFTSYRNGRGDLYVASPFLPGQEEPFLASAPDREHTVLADRYDKLPESWSPDGKRLVIGVYSPESEDDLWVLPLDEPQAAAPLFRTPFWERDAQVSPDGRWIAFVSDESGRDEADVAPFPDAGRKTQVSTRGGRWPRWRADGSELFFMTQDLKLASAAFRPGEELQAAPPVELFELGFKELLDVAADGQRFLMQEPLGDPYSSQLDVVVGWTPGPESR